MLKRKSRPTHEQAVKAFLDLKKKLGRRPTCAEYNKRCYSYHLIRRAFGDRGWSNLLIAAGEKPMVSPDITRAELIELYHKFKKKLGRQPRGLEFNRACCGTGIITRKFGRSGWKRLVRLAGDQPLVAFGLTEKQLKQEYWDLREKLGRGPKLAEFAKNCHAPKVLDRVFGKPGWQNFLNALGEKIMRARSLSAEHLIQDYLELCSAIKRIPTQDEFRKRHIHTPKVLDRVFGKSGWSNLKHAALVHSRKKPVK